MRRLFVIALALVFPLVAVMSASRQKPRRGNRKPVIESFTSSMATLRVCPFHPELYDKPQVDLVVKATDPDGDELQYEYSTSEGTIIGKGKSVTWDLNDALRGEHVVHVTVTDRKGGKAEARLTVTTVDGGSCDPPPPPCPVLKVSCPDELDKSKPFIFSADIEGEGPSNGPPVFHWKLNAGKIVKGQNEFEIEASTTGANAFDSITATVEVSGYDPSCAMAASCTTRIIW